jgi:hypothetical protein
MKISIKKFVLFSFILLEFVSAMAFASTPPAPVPVVPDAASSLRTKVTVSFTIARRRDCDGFGICDWEVTFTFGKINNCTGSLFVDDYNKSILVLEVDKAKGISAEGYKKYFGSGVFLVEDDSPLPGELVKSLGLIGNKTLIAGKYNVIERNGILTVSLSLK